MLKVQQVVKDQLVILVRQVPKVHKEIRVTQGLKVPQAIQVLKVLKVILVPLDHKVHKEVKELKEEKGLKDLTDQQGPLVIRVPKVQQDHKGLKVQLE